MATKRPVLCPNCGSHIKKNGYCPVCYMNIKVSRKAHNTSDYYYNIGYDKAVARDLSGAIEALLVSLRYNKKNIMARNLIGLIYYEMGEQVTALSHWVMSVNYQSTNNLAVDYLKELKQDPTMLENVDQIARKYNMALGYAKSGDYDLAILQLKNAIVINPHFVKGYLMLALIYIHINNYEKARTTLRRILKIDKANSQAIHYLHEMGDSDENIIQLQMESIENDGLLENEYMEEISVTQDRQTTKSARKSLKNIMTSRYSRQTVKTGSYNELHLARFSGVYVLVGLVLGILLLFFVVVPAQKKELRTQNEELIKSYSEELANKNATITTLNDEIDNLNNQLMQAAKQSEESKNALPDYSSVENGMTDKDIQNFIDNE